MEKVILKITGRQIDMDGNVNKVHISESGEHYLRGGKHYIRYTDRTTMKGVAVPSMLKLSQDSVTITRHGGNIETQLYFERGRVSQTDYHTPYGVIKLEIFTQKLDVELGNVSGDVKIESKIKVEGKLVGSNSTRIEILPAAETLSKLN